MGEGLGAAGDEVDDRLGHIERRIEQEIYWVDPQEVGHVNE